MLLSLLSGPFKPYLYGIATVGILAVGGALWYQSGKIDRLLVEREALKEDINRATEANRTNDRTIKILADERKKADVTCEIRLSAKDRTIRDLRAIDNLRPGHGVPPSVVGMGSADGGDGAGLLDALNGMLPGQSSGADGIHTAGSPTGAAGAPILSGDVVYCVDEISAKNLLKNYLLLRAWAVDMVTILVSVQTGTI